MRLLIDTSVFLRLAVEPEALSQRVRDGIDTAERRYLSAASAWEISIKSSLGKLALPEPIDRYVTTRMVRFGFEPLPISFAHTFAVRDLPRHHGDPFDRLLIAQAMVEDLTIATTDETFARYSARVLA